MKLFLLASSSLSKLYDKKVDVLMKKYPFSSQTYHIPKVNATDGLTVK